MARTTKKSPAEKSEVRSGSKADISTVENSVEKSEPKAKKKVSKSFAENTIRDSETAKKRGAKGGVNSGKSRRNKKEARELAIYLLGRMTKSANAKTNLDELGVEKSEFSNMTVLLAKLFTMAMAGDIEAFRELMKLAGYDPEENRKERESVSSDERRAKELDAKLIALGKNPDGTSVSLHLNDEDANNDVVIYMPQTLSEEDCKPDEEDLTEASVAE